MRSEQEAPAGGVASGTRVDRGVYEQFVASLSLATVDLVAIGGERQAAGEASHTRYDLSARYQVDAGAIHYRFDVEGHLGDDDATELGEVRASVIVTITIEATPDEGCVELFGHTSALMIAYPYLREALASTAQRLGFSGILLPLRKYTPDTPSGEAATEDTTG